MRSNFLSMWQLMAADSARQRREESVRYNKQMRDRISKDAEGKTIARMHYEETEEYWVIEFTDGSEICVRLMAELV